MFEDRLVKIDPIYSDRDIDISFCENCEQLAEMSEEIVNKRRKTRRGKKKTYKNLTDSVDQDNFLGRSLSIQKQIMNRRAKCKTKRLLRTPVSPKAPMNSTQFLIEDRDDYILHEDICRGLSSPEQMLISRSESPDLDGSFYEGMDDKMDPLQTDDEYVPLEETTSFMGREFEREFAEYRYLQEKDTKLNLKHKLIKERSKMEIVEKIIELENKLKDISDPDFSSRSTCVTENNSLDLMSEIVYLRKANSSLKEENKLLKNLIT